MIKKFWKKNAGLILFLLFILQMTLFYKLIQTHFPTGVIFKTGLDDKIPFIPIFVIPYFFYFLILLLPFVLAFRDRKKFFAISTTFLLISIICNLIYILFQTTINRPEILVSSIFNKMILFIYSIDAPLNLFPSGHVTFSVLSTLCVFKLNKKIGYIILPITILIIFSTIFIKQHHIPDVIAGLILASLGYFIFKKFAK